MRADYVTGPEFGGGVTRRGIKVTVPNFGRGIKVTVPILVAVWLGAAQAKIVGTDDRIVPSGRQARDAAAVGIVACRFPVERRGRRFGWGTGTLVLNRSTVLTTSHNFFKVVDGEPVAYSECSFRQFDADGNAMTRRTIVATTFGGFDGVNGTIYDDWAVVTLDEPVPEDVVPHALAEVESARSLASARDAIEIFAFHASAERSRQRFVLVSKGRIEPVISQSTQYVYPAHTADTLPAASGAAILRVLPDGTKAVIGIHTGAYDPLPLNRLLPIDARVRRAIVEHAETQSD